MIESKALRRDEVALVWSIDRSERIEHAYRVEDGQLRLRPDPCDQHGWPPGEAEAYTPRLLDCYDRGGWFEGLFEGGRLIGVAVVESMFIGPRRDRLQLKFLHVDFASRGRGLGRRLFERACDVARSRGAAFLYVSSTPSQRTVDFYLQLGCRLAHEPDPELLRIEPEDIHLECPLRDSAQTARVRAALKPAEDCAR